MKRTIDLFAEFGIDQEIDTVTQDQLHKFIERKIKNS